MTRREEPGGDERLLMCLACDLWTTGSGSNPGDLVRCLCDLLHRFRACSLWARAVPRFDMDLKALTCTFQLLRVMSWPVHQCWRVSDFPPHDL
jgi:hypothetical protein